MRRMLEGIAPSRMGRDFRWLLASSWITNLGDGIALAAGPLLIASQTSNPVVVASAALLQRAPWLFFGLFAGWLADRVDRRRIIVVANVARTFVLFALSTLIITDRLSVAAILCAVFTLGTAETFADTTAGTVLPMVVGRQDLGIANARLSFGHKALNELGGPPLGAAIFAAGLLWPFVTQAVTVGLGAVLIAQIAVGAPDTVTASGGIRADVIDGVRWLWGNPPMRTLALTVVLFNVTFGAMWPMLVLYSSSRLGLGEVGFGLLLSASAAGGVVGALIYGWLERHVSLANLMRVGLMIETLTHLGLALSRWAPLSMAILFAFGVQASVWGTTSTAIRQRAVPEELQGRVFSVYLVGVFGSLFFGGIIGATLAGLFGILAPFWFGFVGSAILVTALWRAFGHIAHADSLNA